jgi:hypothetical protein
VTRRLPLLLVALALTAGCGGPDRTLDLGFKEVPSDVVMGAQTSPTPTAGPVAVPLPPPPSVVTLPPPPYSVPVSVGTASPPPPLSSPTACPAPDLLAAPTIEAPNSIAKPPVRAAYLFDNRGTFSVTGPDARTGSFPPRTVRLFSNIKRGSAGSFQYDVSERIGDTTTTTTYGVVTDSVVPEQNGLFLAKMTYLRSDGVTAQFAPTPPLRLAALPLVRGATSDQSAVDPQTQTAMSFTSTVEGKARVYACGVPLDTWTIHLTKGRLLGPDQDLTFDATYQLATQFGGIIIQDVIAFTGSDAGNGVRRANRATVAQTPRAP